MSFREWWDNTFYYPAQGFWDGLTEGITNWWYKNTGQAHLTSEYQHEEELANTAYQRASQDMQLAGLSKFGGVNPASSPSPKSGNGLLATAMAGAQLKSQLLQNKEHNYNLRKAKQWGVPTSAVGDFAKWDALSKVLFGKPLHEIIGEGGLMARLQDFFGDYFPGSESGSGDKSPVFSPDVGATMDTIQNMAKDFAPLQPVFTSPLGSVKSNVYKPVPLVITPKDTLRFEKWKSSVLKGEELPSTGSPAPTPLSLATSVLSKTLGTDVLKDVNHFMTKMSSDGVYDVDTIKRVANSLSKRYGKSEQDIYDYMMAWISEHEEH